MFKNISYILHYSFQANYFYLLERESEAYKLKKMKTNIK